MLELDRLAADFRRAWLALRHEVVGARGERREIVRPVARHVFGHDTAVKLLDEAYRNLGAAPYECGAGLLDGGASCGSLATARSGHGTSCA